MTHIARETAFDRDRNRQMQNEILSKQTNGFTSLKTIPIHTVSANYDLKLAKFGYSPRFNRRINPFKLGYSNPFVKTHFNIPLESIFITEAQKYFNSRMAMYYPDWQSRWVEQTGHNDIDLWLDTQRPRLIDPNIRELSRFIEIINLDLKYNEFSKVNMLKWKIRIIDNCGLFEKYMQSGKTDKSCYSEITVVADYNVFDCYNSQCCKPKFYQGHFDEDFDYEQSTVSEENYDAYIKYLLENDDELPQNFYRKRSS